MAKLSQMDIQNNAFKRAYDREELLRAKFAYLAKQVQDKRLKKLFKTLEITAQRHLAELKQEMQKLDIR
ncbi:hypothetical protein [Desulforamulus ferrireducens]|uniref:Rubrerythrin diiron-binding domain-containing protein n=1 Tax=Desulforamulus ferrireducens TaxID=1833852 RepID=A0A1S6IV67_9FIRM|nr:hypothetical protein [Desulforamulus ferrireducens]AQS58660.1 hypothetical protein B0537_05905 [Desulforamulus ferrireducens]